MRRYLISILAVSLVLVLAAFIAMPLLVLYFAVLTAGQHLLVVRSMQKSPKTFVQIFLGSTIGVLFIHLIVLGLFLISHPEQGRRFLIAFCIGYVVYLVFETVSLVHYVDQEKKRRQS